MAEYSLDALHVPGIGRLCAKECRFHVAVAVRRGAGSRTSGAAESRNAAIMKPLVVAIVAAVHKISKNMTDLFRNSARDD